MTRVFLWFSAKKSREKSVYEGKYCVLFMTFARSKLRNLALSTVRNSNLLSGKIYGRTFNFKPSSSFSSFISYLRFTS